VGVDFHLDRRRVVLLTDYHCDGHSKRREIGAHVRRSQQVARRGIAGDVGGQENSDEVLDDIVHLSKRYINDRFMPDKAIDLLDETAAHLRLDKGKTPPEVRKLQKELKLVNTRIDEAVDGEDYERAAREKTRASQIHEDAPASTPNAPAVSHAATAPSAQIAGTAGH